MAVTLEQFGLQELAADDRLELVGLLWESLDEGQFGPPEWHIRELATRIVEADANPDAAIPWVEYKAKWLGEA